MIKAIEGYLYIHDGKPSIAVTDKSILKNAEDEKFERITLVISMSQIKEWNEEIELLGLDEEEGW